VAAPDSCTVIIAAADLLPLLKRPNTPDAGGEVIEFTDTEALRALDVIMQRRPRVVTIERRFAATPRGQALINRIKADPALGNSEIRVVSHDSDEAQVTPRRVVEAAAIEAPEVRAVVFAEASLPAQPLDQRGTRRAARFKIAKSLGAMLDGNAAMLVDLSRIGAQVVLSVVLKPNQRVRMALNDDHGSLRFNAAVAWASFEIPPNSGPRYRAGVEFVDADGAAVDGFCQRHKAT
jgi:hypothetical protein